MFSLGLTRKPGNRNLFSVSVNTKMVFSFWLGQYRYYFCHTLFDVHKKMFSKEFLKDIHFNVVDQTFFYIDSKDRLLGNYFSFFRSLTVIKKESQFIF